MGEPTSYNQMTEEELTDAGAQIVIYGNHLLRSVYMSMLKTAESIREISRLIPSAR